MQRREFLTTMPIAATVAATAAGSSMYSTGPSSEAAEAKQQGPLNRNLRFHADGNFRILCISDLHYTATPDPYAISLTERLIETEHPDFLIVNGDAVRGGLVNSTDEMATAVQHVATVMEKMGVPWAVTLGNHDLDGEEKHHVARKQLMSYFEAYPHNYNAGWVQNVHGVGNNNILIWDATGTVPIFNLWLLDSGTEHSDPSVRFDWIHSDQVNWYVQTSLRLENTYKKPVSALMFFHICIPEFHEMSTTGSLVGEKGEHEDGSHINGGLFAAVLERKDVKAIICGHDHENNYIGRYHGVLLGYDGVAGFTKAYPYFASKDPKDPANGRARGGRMLVLNANNPAVIDTWMRFNDGSRSWESSYSL